MHGSQSVQSPSPTLLQDPALLHQLLPALKATLQMNNGSMDVAKLNEGQGSNQSALRNDVEFYLQQLRTLLRVLAHSPFCVCGCVRARTFPLTFSPVLAAAVTQASLRSVLHKLLAAGPAFNITALLSAAQHSNQGTASSLSRHPPELRPRSFKGSRVCFGIDSSFRLLFLPRLIPTSRKRGLWD